MTKQVVAYSPLFLKNGAVEGSRREKWSSDKIVAACTHSHEIPELACDCGVEGYAIFADAQARAQDSNSEGVVALMAYEGKILIENASLLRGERAGILGICEIENGKDWIENEVAKLLGVRVLWPGLRESQIQSNFSIQQVTNEDISL